MDERILNVFFLISLSRASKAIDHLLYRHHEFFFTEIRTRRGDMTDSYDVHDTVTLQSN